MPAKTTLASSSFRTPRSSTQFEGQGLASELVAGALDDVRVRGKKIVAKCPYVARFVQKHSDYADLLA